jgi:hypothetical protein
MALPGAYTAKLTVNGQSYTQSITVVQDPRITVPASALAAQFRLQQRMVAGLGATYRGVNHLHDLRAALEKGRDAIAVSQEAAQALPLFESQLAQLETGPQGFGIAHRDLARRLNDQLVADVAPTPSVIAGVDVPCDAIDRAVATLATAEVTHLPALNTALARAGLPALPTWTPPAKPACGAK